MAIAIGADCEKLRYMRHGLSKLCIAYICVRINKPFGLKVHCGVMYNNGSNNNGVIFLLCVTSGKCRLVKRGQ